MRASAVVNCHSTPVVASLRCLLHAPTSRRSVLSEPILRSRHCLARARGSISAHHVPLLRHAGPGVRHDCRRTEGSLMNNSPLCAVPSRHLRAFLSRELLDVDRLRLRIRSIVMHRSDASSRPPSSTCSRTDPNDHAHDENRGAPRPKTEVAPPHRAGRQGVPACEGAE